eukprot:scaffold57442_cov70-Phaeocystis_antarctica.AAC.11
MTHKGSPHVTCSHSSPASRVGPVHIAASVLSARCRYSYQSSIAPSTLDAPIRRSCVRVSCVTILWNRARCSAVACLCLRLRFRHTSVGERHKLLQAQTRCCERGAAPPLDEVFADLRHPLAIEVDLTDELVYCQVPKSRTFSHTHVVVIPLAGMGEGRDIEVRVIVLVLRRNLT